MRGSTRVVAVVTVAVLATSLMAGTANAGPMVKRAQRALNQLGCHAGPADGIRDQMTRAATMRFQGANRIGQTGRLNAKTRQRLFHSQRARRCDRRPVPSRSGKGRRIVLSQRQNHLWLVGKHGHVRAQGGIIDNPRVLKRGVHFTGRKCGRAARIRNNSDYSGRLRLHNFVRFAPCGIGFHQVPTYWSSGRQIHRNFLLGTNLKTSGGCVRLSRKTSYDVWRFTQRRTKVVVVRG